MFELILNVLNYSREVVSIHKHYHSRTLFWKKCVSHFELLYNIFEIGVKYLCFFFSCIGVQKDSYISLLLFNTVRVELLYIRQTAWHLKLFFKRHFTINRNINLRLRRDEKGSGKKICLSAKYEPLNTDAKVNWHLCLIPLLFFSGMVKGEARGIKEIARTRHKDTRDRWRPAVSQQTVSNCVVFCFLYVRWSELWNRHRSNFGNKITVYRRYPFGARDGNVTFPTPCPFSRL